MKIKTYLDNHKVNATQEEYTFYKTLVNRKMVENTVSTILKNAFGKNSNNSIMQMYNFCTKQLSSKKGALNKWIDLGNNTKTGIKQGADYINVLTTFLELRSKVLNTSIGILYGKVDTDRKLIGEYYIEQSELGKVLKFNINSGDFLITESAKKLEQYQFQNSGKNSLWQQILNFSFPQTGGKNAYSNNKIAQKNIHSHSYDIYDIINDEQNFDDNIKVGFTTKNNSTVQGLYYYCLNKDYINYNRGWLYEWFNDWWYNTPNEEKGADLLTLPSIEWLVANPDRAIFLKGGDMVNGPVQNSVNDLLNTTQVKYGNSHVLNIVQLRTTMIKVKIAIEKFFVKLKNGKVEVADHDFIKLTKNLQKAIDKDQAQELNDRIMEILSPFA